MQVSTSKVEIDKDHLLPTVDALSNVGILQLFLVEPDFTWNFASVFPI